MNRTGNDDCFSLRTCRYADVSQLDAIERESFPDHPYSSTVFVDFLIRAKEGFIVVCSGDSVVGYVIATGDGGEGMIQSMAVAPSVRRRGVGAMLMASVIEQLSKKHKRITLLVDASNQAAIRLYRRFGFSESGSIIESYYPNGNDATEMAREAIPGERTLEPEEAEGRR